MSLTGLANELSETAVAPPSWLFARGRNLVVALLLLAFLVIGWRGRDPVQIASGDDLIYLSLSRSLQSGSYREIFRASAPLHVKYPPGYPAWLVLVRQVTGDHLALIVVSNLLLVALSFVILFVVARRFVGEWLALAFLALMALSPALLWTGGSLYSEALFLLISTGALAMALKADRTSERGAVFAAIALALLAFLTRTAGIALVLGVGVWIWRRRKPAELMVYGLASAVVTGGWIAYASAASPDPTARSYANDLADATAIARTGQLTQLASRLWHNAVNYGTETLPAELSVPTIPGTLIDNWIWLVVQTVLISAGIVFLWKTWRAAAAYLVLYVGLLVFWPWPIGRLLSPVIPLVLLVLLLGARGLTQRMPVRARALALGTLVAVLLFGAARGAIDRVEKIRPCDRANPYASPGCYSAETRTLVAAADYLRLHTAPTDVVLANRPAGMQFLSGHLSEPAVLLQQVPPGAAASTLRARKIQHVVLTAVSPFERATLAGILQRSCTDFRVEAQFAPYAILLAPSPPDGTGADACAAIAEFIREKGEPPHPTPP
jgi:4-amino-4-deoxy-L-arabinose transferase-like glycosyltransferase